MEFTERQVKDLMEGVQVISQFDPDAMPAIIEGVVYFGDMAIIKRTWDAEAWDYLDNRGWEDNDHPAGMMRFTPQERN